MDVCALSEESEPCEPCLNGFPPAPLFVSLDSLGRSELNWLPLPLSFNGLDGGCKDADFDGDAGAAFFTGEPEPVIGELGQKTQIPPSRSSIEAPKAMRRRLA